MKICVTWTTDLSGKLINISLTALKSVNQHKELTKWFIAPLLIIQEVFIPLMFIAEKEFATDDTVCVVVMELTCDIVAAR